MSATAVTAHSGLHEAILAIQAETPTLPKNAINPHFRSKYTPLDTIVEKMGPILQKHGVTFIALPSVGEFGPSLRYKLTHAASGDVEEAEMPLLLSKNDPQGQGAAITYARRYALTAALNIVADEDVDGNDIKGPDTTPKRTEATKPAKLSKAQLAKITDRLVKAQPSAVMVQLGSLDLNSIDDATPAQAKLMLDRLGV